MENYQLSNQDYKNIDRIIDVTNSIGSLYQKMSDLEADGKQDTEEFEKCLTYLKLAIEVEEKVYQDANLDYLKCREMAQVLKNSLFDHVQGNIDSIINQEYEYGNIRRILGLLNLEALKNVPEIPKVKVYSFMAMMQYIFMDSSEKEIQTIIELEDAFEKDLLSGYLAILQEYIQNQNGEIRQQLIHSKYYVSFIYKQIEEDMIANSFVIPSHIYVNSRYVADITSTDLDVYQNLKKNFIIKESKEQILNMLSLKDSDYKSKKNIISSFLIQCLIRSSFLFMDEDIIEEMNYSFHEYIEGKDYLKEHFKDRISEQFIVDCFKAVKKDKNKPFELSLAYRKQN